MVMIQLLNRIIEKINGTEIEKISIISMMTSIGMLLVFMLLPTGMRNGMVGCICIVVAFGAIGFSGYIYAVRKELPYNPLFNFWKKGVVAQVSGVIIAVAGWYVSILALIIYLMRLHFIK